ncbi:MAG: hypothetical protein ACYSUT_03395 [Planctomycetota bacterium]|jgi:hypothetical protein
MEIVLTDRIAALTWQLARAARIQSGTISALTTDRQKEQLKKALDLKFGSCSTEVDEKVLEVLGISWKEYRENTKSMKKKAEYCNHLRELLRQHYYQQIQEIGPYKHDDMELGRIAYRDFSNTRVLERMSMYERRIESCLYRTTQELTRLQTRRIAMEQKSQANNNDNPQRNVIPAQAGIHPED